MNQITFLPIKSLYLEHPCIIVRSMGYQSSLAKLHGREKPNPNHARCMTCVNFALPSYSMDKVKCAQFEVKCHNNLHVSRGQFRQLRVKSNLIFFTDTFILYGIMHVLEWQTVYALEKGLF